MTPSPHLLRVVADQPWEIVCPYPGTELGRECMFYAPCGHTFDGDFVEAVETVDGFSCNHHAKGIEAHHLWLREPELVMPTLACELVLKGTHGIQVLDPVEFDRKVLRDIPGGDWPILSWTRKGGRWTRDTMPHLQIVLDTSNEAIPALAV